ncbi:hypothetical protein HII36_01475 [Nonomuraea sp. NN258]|uniref:DUF3987 domain-containing protein n=1 Tax=Nonomuraea antri TaxID=2730852 RepID=UPI001567F41B|nr:DUF3987 domain-containing protein [Nonomuraea antri]NRQ30516.1 hypothetical protein [Nonomuraea antri]
MFGSITSALDPYTEGDRTGVLVSLMAGFSAYIGNGPAVETGKGASPLMFWPVLCGPSGLGRKGTATGIASRVLEAAFRTFSEDNTVHGLPATGLGFIGELDERSANGTAQPVLFLEEEMDTFITNARRDTKVGVYLRKAWDGQTISHKTKHDDVKIRRPHVAIIGHVQPKNWAAISGSRDATGGTYNRFFPVWVYQSKTLPVFEATDTAQVIRACARALREVADWARDADTVTVPRHVAQVFETTHRPICEALTNGSEELSQYTERAMAYMVRLAALYALADQREEISVADFDAALALVTYSVESVAYILPEAEMAQELPLALRVERFIAEAGETGVASTVIYRKFGIRKAELETLIADMDTIESFKAASTGGRPAQMYRYVGAPAADDADDIEGDTIWEVFREDVPTEDAPEESAEVAPVFALAPAPAVVASDETEVLSGMKDAAPAASYYLTEDEWDEVDASTPEPVVPAIEEPAAETVTESAVRAFLTTPAGTEMLQEILSAMMAAQAPTPAPAKRPARASRSRSKVKLDAASLATVDEVAA